MPARMVVRSACCIVAMPHGVQPFHSQLSRCVSRVLPRMLGASQIHQVGKYQTSISKCTYIQKPPSPVVLSLLLQTCCAAARHSSPCTNQVLRTASRSPVRVQERQRHACVRERVGVSKEREGPSTPSYTLLHMTRQRWSAEHAPLVANVVVYGAWTWSTRFCTGPLPGNAAAWKMKPSSATCGMQLKFSASARRLPAYWTQPIGTSQSAE